MSRSGQAACHLKTPDTFNCVCQFRVYAPTPSPMGLQWTTGNLEGFAISIGGLNYFPRNSAVLIALSPSLHLYSD